MMKTTKKNILRIAILASGKGSNAVSLIKAWQQNPSWPIEIVCVVCDQPSAPVLTRAQELGVQSFLIPKGPGTSRRDHEQQILSVLKQDQEQDQDNDPLTLDWIFLAGYMRILSPFFLASFYDEVNHYYRVMNIHPSFLPAFAGVKDGFYQTYISHLLYGGVTVHLVDEGIDSGPIVLQEKFEKKNEESFDDFYQRGRDLEQKLYPKALELLAHTHHNREIRRELLTH